MKTKMAQHIGMLSCDISVLEVHAVGGATYTAPSTMGNVWVLFETGFWHTAELFPGSHVLDDRATNVLVILWNTAVPYAAALPVLLSSARGRSWPSCELSGSFILLQSRE
jgi:hypothetical protein